MTGTLSFPATIDVIDSASESRVTFAAETIAPRPVASITATVEAFVTAANAGMFSKDPAAIARPIVVEALESRTPQRLDSAWLVTGVQARAYRVLLNMLEVAHGVTSPLQGIRLKSSAGDGARLTTADLLGAPAAIKAGKPPFELHCRRNLKDMREPLIRLEFKRPITDDELARLAPLFVAWDSVAIRGGFIDELPALDEDLDVDAALASPQTYLAAPDTVEHLFDEFVGTEVAFFALLNMVTRIHAMFSPLASLEIE
jgi:hypothetical protein